MLLLLPTSSNKLLLQWQGCYEVVEWVGQNDYRIRVPEQGFWLYHVKFLKGWQEPEEFGWYNADMDWNEEGKEQSQDWQRQVATGLPASEWQLHHQIQQVLSEYPDAFHDTPG